MSSVKKWENISSGSLLHTTVRHVYNNYVDHNNWPYYWTWKFWPTTKEWLCTCTCVPIILYLLLIANLSHCRQSVATWSVMLLLCLSFFLMSTSTSPLSPSPIRSPSSPSLSQQVSRVPSSAVRLLKPIPYTVSDWNSLIKGHCWNASLVCSGYKCMCGMFFRTFRGSNSDSERYHSCVAHHHSQKKLLPRGPHWPHH